MKVNFFTPKIRGWQKMVPKYILFLSGGPFSYTFAKMERYLKELIILIHVIFIPIPEESVTDGLAELEEGAASGGVNTAVLGIVTTVVIFFLLLFFMLICLGKGKAFENVI